MVDFHRITDVFVWFTCIFSLQGPVMLGTGSRSRNWRNHGHGFKGWFMDPNTDHDDYNEGGNEMNDLEKRKK